MIHRDLKPHNILIDKNGHLVIADLGLAHMFDLTSTKRQYTDHPCGTPGYIAPEVFMRADYDYRADIFSLGAVIHTMFFGRYPWGGNSPREIFDNTLDEELGISRADGITFEFFEALHVVSESH